VDWAKKQTQLAEDSIWLRGRLRSLGLNLISPETEAMPGVVTIVPPAGQSGAEMAQRLEQAGYLLSYNSDYLRQRNWVQICLMGEYSREKLEGVHGQVRDQKPGHGTTGDAAALRQGRGARGRLKKFGCRCGGFGTLARREFEDDLGAFQDEEGGKGFAGLGDKACQ
jgi:hypothetical protein